MPRAMSDAPKPSGTVVVVRDASDGLELLLLQRAPRKDGKPGPWVFPGGKVDPADRPGADAAPAEIARRAAVRETEEEAGLRLAPDSLVYISRWVTPAVAPRRFDTWFFLAPVAAGAAGGDVRVDGEEIHAHRWLAPRDALTYHHEGSVRLAPPTFVTVSWLVEHATAEAALRTLGANPPPPFHPRICKTEGGPCILYPGDAGYDADDPQRAGARHRLWMLAEGWRYERVA